MLDGVPISIKANIAVEGFQLTANSDILSKTAGYDCILTRKLKDAGAIIIGQTNMDEFGMGSLGHYSNNGYTVNPLPVLKDMKMEEYIQRIQSENVPRLDLAHETVILSPGGSSSGSAASVSMGSSIISIGTDTGGSIRLPAAWCGVVGFKPTYGAISRDGVVSYASSLDTVGIIGSSAQCVSFAFDVLRNEKRDDDDDDDDDDIVWQDVRDSTACFVGPVSGWTNDVVDDDALQQDEKSILSGLRVGIPAAFSIDGCSDQVKQAWEKTIEKLEECGATVEIVSDELISSEAVKMCLPAYYVLSCAEASSNLSRYDGLRYGLSNEDNVVAEGMNQREGQFASTRSIGFGGEVQRRILAGTAVLSSDRFHSHYEAATNVRASMTKQFNAAFGVGVGDGDGGNGVVDLMLIPTAVTNPPSLGPNAPAPDSTEAFQNDVMTVPISLAGLPSVSIPVGWNNGGDNDSTKQGNKEYEHRVVGMQIFGPRFSEERILRTAHVLEGLCYSS